MPKGIDEAVAILRDPVRFFDGELYARAVDTIDAGLRVISAAYAPLQLDFTGYRTPFAFTTPEEIAHDASPERDPFDAYVVGTLAPRLRAAGVRAVGISLCFPGQLQPAFVGLKLRRELPGVHLTIGGPAITQLLIRLRGPALAAALGPFDTAVVYEGEHTLLALCRALDEHGDDPRALRGIPNLVQRDRMLGAKFTPGEGSEDMRALPPPDFDGLALEKYFSPVLTLPYDPTRGCYWGKCTFCHYGLAEIGTASYRERSVQTCVDHLAALSAKHGTRHFYLSQDSVAPKTIVRLAEALADAGLELRWATDLKPERYLTQERAETLRRGGAVACALGVESASPRVLGLIDKGAPVAVVSDVIGHLASAGIAAEAMCFTGFPTETLAEALATLKFPRRSPRRSGGVHRRPVRSDPRRAGGAGAGALRHPRDLAGRGRHAGDRALLRRGDPADARRRAGAAGPGPEHAVGGLAAPSLSLGRIAVDGAHGPLLRPPRPRCPSPAGLGREGRRDRRQRQVRAGALQSGRRRRRSRARGRGCGTSW